MDNPPPPSLSSINANDNLQDWIGKKYCDVPPFVSNELLRRLSIPDSAQVALPSKNLTIEQLLALPLSDFQTLVLVSPSQCFSDKVPNRELVSLVNRPIPAPEFLAKLRGLAGQAMLNGKISIKDWKQKDVYLPFSALSFWLELGQSARAKLAWAKARIWIDGQKKNLSAELLEKATAIFTRAAWHGRLSCLGSFCDVTDMAVLLSREMLSSSHVDVLLARLQVRLDEDSSLMNQGIIISSSSLGDGLCGIPAYKYPEGAPASLQHDTKYFQDNDDSITMWTVAYSEPLHFGALRIQRDAKGSIISNWGDSLGRSQPKAMIKGLKMWASVHKLSKKKLVFAENIACAKQTDGYSCSIISINTLKHNIFGDRLWTTKSREALRVTEFIDAMEFYLNHRELRLLKRKLVPLATTIDNDAELLDDEDIEICDKPTEPQPEMPLNNLVPELTRSGDATDVDPPPLDANIALNAPVDAVHEPQVLSTPYGGPDLPTVPDTSTIIFPSSLTGNVTLNTLDGSEENHEAHSRKRFIDSVESRSPSPAPKRQRTADAKDSPATLSSSVTQALVGEISRPEAEHLQKASSKSSDSKSVSQAKSKSTSNAGLTSGEAELSSTAKNKRLLNGRVLDGTFVRNPLKWEKYKATLRKKDPHFEVDDVDPKRACHVRHSGCGKFIKQALPYDTYVFSKHVDKCNVKASTEAQSNTQTLATMFILQPKVLKSQSVKKSTTIWPCPGITAKEVPRIEMYLKRTQVSSAGGDSERTIAETLFGKLFRELNRSEKDVVQIQQRKTHRWRNEHAFGRIYAIGSVPCREEVYAETLEHVRPCVDCKALQHLRQFQTAIDKEIPDDDNMKYTPLLYRNDAIGDLSARTRGYSSFLDEHEKAGGDKQEHLLKRFARQYAQGRFNQTLLGLLDYLTTEQERAAKGKGMQNYVPDRAFDQFMEQLVIIRPEAYNTFIAYFGGRTQRSFQHLRSLSPSFHQGISNQTVERAAQYLKDYGYPLEGPLASGVDDTKLLADFRPYYDGLAKKWFMVGGIGDPLEIADISELQAQVAAARGQQASKIRVWTLTIPLPRVPPLILAAMPIASKTNAKQLATMEESLLTRLLSAGANFNIVLLGSDGASVERDARRELLRSGFAEAVIFRIPHPEEGNAPIEIKVLKIFGRVMAIIQDSKHGRKTTRNNEQSGTKTLVIGAHFFCYEDIRKIAFDFVRSPLYPRDVHKLDRQDDRAAARLFSFKTLEYLVESADTQNLGLIAYLFVFGEMIDAYQNRTMSHHERVRLVLRAKFFKNLWKAFLKDAGYPLSRFYISRELDDIMDILIDGLLGLIYIHRDVLECLYPLLPWLHGTEENEHVFGASRDIIPDFTMLDFLRLVPKLGVRLMNSCKNQSLKADLKRSAAGYCHTYADGDNVNLHFLSIFPTDDEIAAICRVSWDEAVMIAEMCGCCPLQAGVNESDGNMPEEEDDLSDGEDVDEDDEDDNPPSDRQELRDTLQEVAALQAKGLPSDRTDTALDECAYAAAALNIADVDEIEKLASGDEAENQAVMADMRNALAAALAALAAQGEHGQKALKNMFAANNIPLPAAFNIPDSDIQPPTSNQSTAQSAYDLSQLLEQRKLHESRESTLGVRVPPKAKVATSVVAGDSGESENIRKTAAP